MSGISSNEIFNEFLKSKMGIAGISILGILIFISISTVILVPVDTFKEWNNPGSWLSFPKTAVPAWVNYFSIERIPEHKILTQPIIFLEKSGDVTLVSQQFNLHYNYDDFPNDFIYEFTAKYSESPLLEIVVIRPDGIKLELQTMSLPYSPIQTTHNERIFSTDVSIKKNLQLQSENFSFTIENLASENIIFSQTNSHKILKGNYVFLVNLYGVQTENEIIDSTMIVGGKAFGIMGTDELRRYMSRMRGYGESSGSTGGFFGLNSGGGGVRYVCLTCSNKFKGGSCPRCGSKMRRADF